MDNTLSNPFGMFIGLGFLGAILLVILFVLLFFIIREITLWYFKINKNTETLENIASSLEKIATVIDSLPKDAGINHDNIQEKETE